MSWWQPGQLCAYSVFYGKAIVNLHWVVWAISCVLAVAGRCCVLTVCYIRAGS